MNKTLAGFLLGLVIAMPGVAAQDGSKKAEAYFQFARAKTLELSGQWDQALEAYDQALALDPLSSSIYSEIAFAYYARNDAQAARDYANRAILVDEDNLEAHRLLSEIYTRLLTRSNGDISVELVNLAIQEWEEVVRLDPTERVAYLTLGSLYTAIGDPERAAGVYRDFLSVEPASEDGSIALAELQMNAGNADEAIRILSELIATRPDSANALSLLGNIYFQTGDFDNAATTLAAALAASPDDRDLLATLAEALFLSNRLPEATERYEALLDQDREDPVVLLRLGQIYRQQMEYSKARENIEAADRLFPNTTEIRFELAMVDRDEGRFEDALNILNTLLDRTEQPRYTAPERQARQQLLMQVAVVQSITDRYDEAAATFEEMKVLLRAADDGTIDYFIADTLRMGGQPDQALDRVVEARRSYATNRQLQILEADLTAELGDVDRGVAMLRGLLNDSEQDLDVYSTLVGIYEGSNDYETAQVVLDEMRQNLEDDESAWFLQGALYERQEMIDAAENAFRRALEINGENPATLNYLGYMLADRNRDLDEALRMIQTAVAADPINGAYLDSLGWVYFRMQQMDLAEQYLTRAVLFSDSDSTLHEHLGDLYRTTGRYDMARQAYLRSLERADKDEERSRVQEKLDELPPGTI